MQRASLRLLLVLMFGPLFTLDAELVAHQRHVNVRLLYPGQLRREDHGFVVLSDVDARRQHASHAAPEPVLEQGINLALEAAEMFSVALAVPPRRKPGFVGHAELPLLVMSCDGLQRFLAPRARG